MLGLHEGWAVTGVADGVALLAALDSLRPDLVTLDVAMPGLGGIETYRLLRGRDGLGEVPVLFVTAWAERVGHARLPGPHDALAKPFKLADLLARVGALLDPPFRLRPTLLGPGAQPLPPDPERWGARRGAVARRVAVVDDHEPFLDLMRELLESEGYDPLLLAGAEGAPPRLRAFRPDAIILDLRMERRESGWGLLEAIKGDPTHRPTPVIVCSADAPAMRFGEALLVRHGCGQLVKPFHIAHLFDLLRLLIGQFEQTTDC